MEDSKDGPKPPKSPLDDLNPRQRAFVHEYLIDNNGTQAALRAGISSVGGEGYAASAASALLRMPEVEAAIASARAQRETRTKMTQDMVLQEMSLLSHSCIEHYYVDDDGRVRPTENAPEGAMRAIQSIKRRKIEKFNTQTHELTTTYDVEIRLWDKPAPLKLMGRHTGLFPDRVEHTGKGGGPIETVAKIERVIVDAPKDVT